MNHIIHICLKFQHNQLDNYLNIKNSSKISFLSMKFLKLLNTIQLNYKYVNHHIHNLYYIYLVLIHFYFHQGKIIQIYYK